MTGQISYGAGPATAILQAGGHELRLAWQPFRAESATTVTGTLDGHPFAVHVPMT